MRLAVGLAALAVTLVLAPSASAFEYLTEWGGSGTGPGEFNDGPYGIDVGPDGSVYVGECTNSRIQQFTLPGHSSAPGAHWAL